MNAGRPITLNAFMIIGDLKPGKAQELRAMADSRAAALNAEQLRELLKPLTIHFARWAIINDDKQFIYASVFDTDFDKYSEDAHGIFIKTGLGLFFEFMEGFPTDWTTNVEAFTKWFKDHHWPSIFEFTGYTDPNVTVAEINNALAVKRALSDVLDHMQ